MHIYLARARFVVVVCGLPLVGMMHLFSARQVCGGLWRARLVGRMHIDLAHARFMVVGCVL